MSKSYSKIYTITELNNNYNKAKQALINQYNNAPNRQQCKDLQEYLQNNIYGSVENVNKMFLKAQKLISFNNNAILKSIIEGAQNGIANIDNQNTNIEGYIVDGKLGDKYITLENKERQMIGALKGKVNLLNKYLKHNEKNVNSKEIKKVIEDANNYISILLQNHGITDYINFKDDDNWASISKAINSLLQTFIVTIPGNARDWGRTAEVLVSTLSKEFVNIDPENIKEAAVNEVWKGFQSAGIIKNLTGTDNISYRVTMSDEGKNSLKSYSISESVKKKKKGETEKEEKSYFIDLGHGGKISVNSKGDLKNFNPFASEKLDGKIDINFTLPGSETKTLSDTKFRISLKEYGDLSKLKFDTNLAYALVKTFGYFTLNNYSFLYGGKLKNAKSQADKTAYLAIISDALLGASQVSSYADTLVIDDKKGTISVLSLKEVVNKIESLLKDNNFDGYPTNLQEKMNFIFNNNNFTGNDKLALAQNILAQINVQFKYSAIKHLT